MGACVGTLVSEVCALVLLFSMSDFDVAAFLCSLDTVEQVVQCRKQDLVDIAAHLGVTLSMSSKLADLREEVIRILIEQKYLAINTGASVDGSSSHSLTDSEESKKRGREI